MLYFLGFLNVKDYALKGKHIFNSLLVLVILIALSGCSRKGKQSLVNRFYHNTTGYYNTYWNAQQLVDEAERTLSSSNVDDFSEILPVFPYESGLKSGGVSANMDKAIEKTAKVNFFHEKSRWQDDAYVLMGKAQILKNDFVSAEQTLSYFEEAYDPNNPDGRLNNESVNRDEKIKKRAAKRAAERDAKAKKAKEDRAKRIAQKKANDKKKEALEKKQKQQKRSNSIEERSESIKKKKTRKRKANKRKRKKKSKKRKKRRVRKDKSVVNTPTPTQPKRTVKRAVVQKQNKEKTSLKNPKDNLIDESINQGGATLDVKDDTNYNSVYNRGKYLLAEAKARKGQLNEARYILTRLNDQVDSDKFVEQNVPVLRAFIDLKEKDFESAKLNLNKAIEVSNSKREKARYAHILGQLYTQENNYDDAYENFLNAEKWAKTFDMEFHSKINRMYTSYVSKKAPKTEVVNTLAKMAKQDKYDEQQALIYSTLADIYVEENDLDNAKKYLELGAQSKTSSPELKKSSYYNLAMLYYENKNFIDAKTYIDSTLMVLNPDDSKAFEISKLSENLTSISKDSKTIMLNDSLLNMVNLSDDDIKKLAKQRVKKQDKIDKAANKAANGGTEEPVLNNQKNISFPLYKSNSRKKGKQAFDKKWGRRPLVDNWRVKAVIENDLFLTDDEYLDKKDRIEAEIATIKSAIPSTPEAKEAIHKTSEDAYFNLGKNLKLNLDDSEESIKVLNVLLETYPESTYIEDAYYYLYLNHNNLNNPSLAKKYADLLGKEYPESRYNSFFKKSDEVAKGAKNTSNDESLYIKAYEAFDKGNYDEALRLTDQGVKDFPKSSLIKKFELLNIMAKASNISKDEYIKLLKNFYRRNANIPEGIKASALLTTLTSGEEVSVSDKPKENKKRIEYNLKFDVDHYVIIGFKNTPISEITPIRSTIAKFNSTNFKSDKLKISFTTLKNETKDILIIIKNFDDSSAAGGYLEAIKEAKDIFDSKKDKIEFFSISKFNYRRMKKVNTLEGYREFYKKNYSL